MANGKTKCPNCGQFKFREKYEASMYFYIIFFVIFVGGCAVQGVPGGGVGMLLIGIGGIVLTYFISSATKDALVHYTCENCDFEQSYNRK
jgi:hypothetical protein